MLLVRNGAVPPRTSTTRITIEVRNGPRERDRSRQGWAPLLRSYHHVSVMMRTAWCGATAPRTLRTRRVNSGACKLRSSQARFTLQDPRHERRQVVQAAAAVRRQGDVLRKTPRRACAWSWMATCAAARGRINATLDNGAYDADATTGVRRNAGYGDGVQREARAAVQRDSAMGTTGIGD